jgi:hypothetical protein
MTGLNCDAGKARGVYRVPGFQGSKVPRSEGPKVRGRFDQEDVGFAQIDAHFLRVEARLDRLGGDLSKSSRWIVGIQSTTLLTVVATLLGALAMR